MTLLQAIILSIIEGITEFLPVSSTGHMIIASSFMGIAGNEFTKLFTVAVQLGAILSVVALYYKRFFQTFDFYLRLFVAFIPIAIVGLLLKKHIEAMLGNVLIVGISLFVGGIILLFIDKIFPYSAAPSEDKNKGIPNNASISNPQDLDRLNTIDTDANKSSSNQNAISKENADSSHVSYRRAFIIGLFQIIALIPGVSRSAATIIGGLSQKLTRRAAAEFAFFLAVPTMFAATGKELYDTYKRSPDLFTQSNMTMLAIGNVIAFFVALIAIRSFVSYLSKHGFKVFGIYRIITGLLIIILVLTHTGNLQLI